MCQEEGFFRSSVPVIGERIDGVDLGGSRLSCLLFAVQSFLSIALPDGTGSRDRQPWQMTM